MVSCAAYKRLCSSWWMVNHQLKLGSRYKWNHCRALWPSLSSLPLRGDFSPPRPSAAAAARRRLAVFKKSFIRSRSPRVDGDVVRSLQSKHGEKTSYGGLPRSPPPPFSREDAHGRTRGRGRAESGKKENNNSLRQIWIKTLKLAGDL